MASITLFQAPLYDRMNPTLAFLLVGFGLPGMLVMMQVAQLAPQVLASRHTKQFLDIPGGRALVRLALTIELLGITECANAVKLLIERCCCGSRVQFGGGSRPAWKAVESHPRDVEDGAEAESAVAAVATVAAVAAVAAVAKKAGGTSGRGVSGATASSAETMNPLLTKSASWLVGKIKSVK